MDQVFVEAVQARAARIAVSASATRGQRAPGLVAAGREFCVQLDLSRFAVGRNAVFMSRLDGATGDLKAVLPHPGRSWGMARKLLNIFLRDALYSVHLAELYGLASAEAFLEVPLDSITAKQLRRVAPRGALPTWPGVKHLSPGISARYQQVAQREAERMGVARVHLDTFWWGGNRAG